MAAVATTWDGNTTAWDQGYTTWDYDVAVSPDGCYELLNCGDPDYQASGCVAGTLSLPCAIVPCFIPCGDPDTCVPPRVEIPTVPTGGTSVPCLAIPCQMIPCRSN